MAPWAGRIGGGVLEVDVRRYQLPTRAEPNALHGTTYEAAWDVGYVDDDAVALHTDLGPEWPFQVRRPAARTDCRRVSSSPCHLARGTTASPGSPGLACPGVS